nr:hypothetical protein [Variovorax boronicumulans]
MKQTTLDALLMARTLIERATELARSDDRHLASAGLVLIQDSLEMTFYALLIERGIDEAKSLEGKSFDELIGELKKEGISVPKSGTLKALNKQRVLTKHYAQVAEPNTVRGYLDAALSALESIVPAVIGRPLRELYFSDFLDEGESKGHLKLAEALISAGKFFDAVIETRKAFFIEFEASYSVHGWRDFDEKQTMDLFARFLRGGEKAHSWMRNKSWIEKNVKEPTDYVQINEEQWRIDALEWGIHTAELANLRRLTPPVFREKAGEPWAAKIHLPSKDEQGTETNAKYCLDRAISAILKKHQHGQTHRKSGLNRPLDAPESYAGHSVYARATKSSEIVHTVNLNYVYSISDLVDGFDPTQRFVRISGTEKTAGGIGLPWNTVFGYLEVVREA